MNKEYIYINGNVILEDEKGNKSPIEYSYNLDEILIQENIIETMENEKQELERKNANFKENRRTKKSFILFPFLVFSFMPMIVFTIFGLLGISDSNTIMNTMYGPIRTDLFNIIAFTTLFSPCGALLSTVSYMDYKKDKKEENARKASVEYLNGALEKAKEDLNEMKKQKKEENKKTGFRIVKINDSKQIRELYGHINLYYDCGYNGQKYYRYYQKHNKLPKKVENNYTELGQELVKEYLEEKGKTFVKKRN